MMKGYINKGVVILLMYMIPIGMFMGCSGKTFLHTNSEEFTETATTTGEEFYSNYLSQFSQEDISYGLMATKQYFKNNHHEIETTIIFLSKNVSLIKDIIGENYDYGKEMVIEAQIYADGTECDRVLLLRKNDAGNWYVDSEK